MKPIDILILSNGPGEITTWVRPVVVSLRNLLGNDRSQVRISVMLSPCPHSTGQESLIVENYIEVDRVQSSKFFFPFILFGKTSDNWDWRKKGIVLFLGGDQFYTLLVSKRLGYKSLTYAEWEARWYRWLDTFAVMNQPVINKVPQIYQNKFIVVGDLMADFTPAPLDIVKMVGNPFIALLPGSKAGKLTQGVPLCLAIAKHIYQQRPNTYFILPVAPTLNISDLVHYAQSSHNPIVKEMGGVEASLTVRNINKVKKYFLQINNGPNIELINDSPAHSYLRKCCLALTTVGANTAELGALGIPMIVLLPTQKLDAMRTWDGIPGILSSLPFVGSKFAKFINSQVIKEGRLFAWPNIWAKEKIVPELVGELQPDQIANKVLDFLNNPLKLQKIHYNLLKVRGNSGAAFRIAKIIRDQLDLT
ncbi:MAG: hypothetical protein ucyna2_01193 [Candidatus Atelocyanobacterium thalassa isolate SIO64986]|uniref:Uncharacterized protein n=1 Tax=Candidatus Atelocyanobacterium thalassa isolate SIO64986 TaxID=1527444 RepID=A0A086CFM0_9CHRO|nr:MAG: hypothetical protein ucyna2_01193 [Candidatus Atelocyanobacterium thalassa isolate SIO64986]